MKKEKYIVNHFLTLALIIIFFGFSAIVLIICKEYWAGIFSIISGFLLASPYIFMRKIAFAKMLINEEGFKIFYRGNIIKQLKWEDIKDVKAIPDGYGGTIFFSDKPLYEGKERWKNSKEISVRMYSKFAIYLFQYKDKIPVPIRDLDKLPKSIQEKLQK